jgi:hypothetical protein
MSIWGLPLITALVAGDIVASESAQRDAEDDPHALARPRRGVRREGARDVDVHARGRLRDGLVGLVAGSIAWGFHPLTSLSGRQVSAATASAAAAQPRRLPLPLAGIAAFG